MAAENKNVPQLVWAGEGQHRHQNKKRNARGEGKPSLCSLGLAVDVHQCNSVDKDEGAVRGPQKHVQECWGSPPTLLTFGSDS